MAIVGKEVKDDEVMVDRISVLPDQLLDRIVDMLPMSDVFRISVLSKRWKCCWTRFGNLDFGEEFFKKYIISRGHNLVSIIDSVMSLHDGPVYRGHLYVRGYDDEEFESLNFTKWIQFLSKNGIKDLSVHTAHMGYVGIPSDIFNCCSLQRLHLFICQLEPSLGFSGFRKLISLELLYCKLPDSLLESMISNSPLLEELVLVDPKPREHFAVDAPNLKSLKLFNFEPTPLCLVEYSKLTTASICSALMIPANKFTASALSKFSSFLPRIENLSTHWTTLASLGAGGVPFRLPTPFKYLEHLELDEFDVVSLDPIFCLLHT
uniref:F-box domain-containing protein n=1 Tax=Kalanchoe fedtschenkoi TaxID=63787 RepID=A0A7N0T1J3_KALFE